MVLLFLQLVLLWGVNHFTNGFDPARNASSISHWITDEKTSLFCEGEIDTAPKILPHKTNFVVSLHRCSQINLYEWKRVSGRVSLSLADEHNIWRSGDVIRFKAAFKLPVDFKNPGGFSWTQYLKSRGIVATGFVEDPRWITVVKYSQEWGGAWLEKIRQNVREMNSGDDSESKNFLLSLLIGEQFRLSLGSQEKFQRAGVSHILSISGLHVTLVSLIFLFFLRTLSLVPGLKHSVRFFRYYPLLAIMGVWLYVLVAHAPVASVRAGIMATFLLSSLILWERLDLLSALSLAAFLILCLVPLSLWHVSFQLTFAAMLFLILLYPRLRDLVRRRWPEMSILIRWLVDSLLISAITFFTLWPILLFHFHTVSAMGFVANLIVVPMVNILILPLGLIGLFFTGILGLKFLWLWQLLLHFSNGTLLIVSFFDHHSGRWIWHGRISPWQMLFYYLGIFVWFLPRQKNIRWIKCILVLLFAVLIFGGWKMNKNKGQLRATFLDIGQGDSTVLELPGGEVWLVDGGGIRGSDWDLGQFVIAPYLWSQGIHKVDRIFLSHPHHDHYKGLSYIVQHFVPKILYMNGDHAPEKEREEWDAFLKIVEQSKVSTQIVHRGTKDLQVGEVQLQWLMPESSGVKSMWNTNDNSAVFRVQYRDISFLMTGDLEREGEKTLLQANVLLKSTVLKAGHHGSQTSSTIGFLDAVKPEYAVISVGAYNPYGLPDEWVLDRFKERNIQTLRTDQNGAITITTDGKKIATETFIKF